MRTNLGIDTSPDPALPSIFIIASQARAAKGDAYSHLSLITPGYYRTANGASSRDFVSSGYRQDSDHGLAA